MDVDQFKQFANAMIDYIGNYLENIRDRKVLPDVEPGYLRSLIPSEAPSKSEKWQDILADVERVIMPGVTHWHSPRFHAYFPTANSYPALVADMLSDAIACIGFTWMASPACTELEVIMMDWLAKMLNLPEFYLYSSTGQGGGVIQGTASEATLVALLGAKARIIRKIKEQSPETQDTDIVPKLVAYASEQAHSSVERAGLLGGIKFRLLPINESYQLCGDTLETAIEKDKEDGLIPFYVVATLGTTSICSFDKLDEIGPICKENDIWLHVDAAYAGSAFVCPEYQYLMNGVEYTDSFNFNPHKWMLVTFDCSAMWLKNSSDVVNAFNVDPLYLKHDQQGAAPDYRHWQIPLGRRFRSLKLWFVMRIYGIENIQAHIRRQIAQAREFEDLVRSDDRFEVVGDVTMALVCFRLKASNECNDKLLRQINGNGKIYLVPSKINDLYFLRFAVCSRYTQSPDIRYSWDEIKSSATTVLLTEKDRGKNGLQKIVK